MLPFILWMIWPDDEHTYFFLRAGQPPHRDTTNNRSFLRPRIGGTTRQTTIMIPSPTETFCAQGVAERKTWSRRRRRPKKTKRTTRFFAAIIVYALPWRLHFGTLFSWCSARPTTEEKAIIIIIIMVMALKADDQNDPSARSIDRSGISLSLDTDHSRSIDRMSLFAGCWPRGRRRDDATGRKRFALSSLWGRIGPRNPTVFFDLMIILGPWEEGRDRSLLAAHRQCGARCRRRRRKHFHDGMFPRAHTGDRFRLPHTHTPTRVCACALPPQKDKYG
jgi:hypothetical protein